MMAHGATESVAFFFSFLSPYWLWTKDRWDIQQLASCGWHMNGKKESVNDENRADINQLEPSPRSPRIAGPTPLSHDQS